MYSVHLLSNVCTKRKKKRIKRLIKHEIFHIFSLFWRFHQHFRSHTLNFTCFDWNIWFASNGTTNYTHNVTESGKDCWLWSSIRNYCPSCKDNRQLQRNIYLNLTIAPITHTHTHAYTFTSYGKINFVFVQVELLLGFCCCCNRILRIKITDSLFKRLTWFLCSIVRRHWFSLVIITFFLNDK